MRFTTKGIAVLILGVTLGAVVAKGMGWPVAVGCGVGSAVGVGIAQAIGGLVPKG